MSFGTQALTSEDFYKENVELEREIKDFDINAYDKTMYKFIYTYNYDFRIGEKFDISEVDVEIDNYNALKKKSAAGKNKRKRSYENNKENIGVKNFSKDINNNYYILDKKYSDITGDNGLDEISLVGYKDNKYEEYSSNIFIVVKDSKTLQTVKLNYEEFEGYDAKLYIADFDGDKINDVLAYSKKERNKDITRNYILSFKDFIVKDIFINNIPDNINISLLNDYIINVEYNNKQIKSILKEEVKRYYNKEKIYINSRLQSKSKNLYISKIKSLSPIDINMDQDFEFIVKYEINDDENKEIENLNIIYDYKDDKLSITSILFE